MKANAYKKMVPENNHKNAIMDYATRIGWVAIRLQTGALPIPYTTKNGVSAIRVIRMAKKGTPDIGGHTDKGIAWYWDAKREGRKPTPEQQAFIDQALSVGCFAGAGTFDDFIEAVEKWKGTLK